MADALNPVGTIYEGFWIDRERGSVWGCTLTLGGTGATVFTNLVAIWVTLCGIQIWTIIRYVLHRKSASSRPDPPTPHLGRQQVILRNTTSAFATARHMFQLARTSRKSTGKRSMGSYAIALSAILYILLFIMAELFSYQTINAPAAYGGSLVLLRGDCGLWTDDVTRIMGGDYSTPDELGIFFQLNAQSVYDVQLSVEYAQECYNSRTGFADKSSTCSIMRNSTVDWKSATTTLCPFESQICHGNSETLVLDTGDIDSSRHLGINAVPSDRLAYRRVTTCAVLNGSSYTSGWDGSIANASSPRPDPDSAYAYYGPSLKQGTNWTYAYSNFASFYNSFSNHVTAPYQLDVEEAYAPADPQWSSSDFEPIPELAQEDADLHLIFLSFTGMYIAEVDDPWFSATQQSLYDNSRSMLRQRYARDAPISTIACKEQHNFCTTHGVCTSFFGFDQVQNVESFNNILTPNQNATFDRMLRAISVSKLPFILGVLAATTTPVRASVEAFDGNSGATISRALPDNQWQIELKYWQSIAMAQLQRSIVRWASGQISPEPGFLQKATTPQDVWFCDNMTIYSAVYQSFSVVAILSVLVFGAVIINIGLFIEPLAALLRKYSGSSESRKYWNRDDMLELKRRSVSLDHDADGSGFGSSYESESVDPKKSTRVSKKRRALFRKHSQTQHSLAQSGAASPASISEEFEDTPYAPVEAWTSIELHTSPCLTPSQQMNVTASTSVHQKRKPVVWPHTTPIVPHSHRRVEPIPMVKNGYDWI